MFFLAPISKSKPGLNNNWRQLPHTSHANQSEWYCKCLVDPDRNNTMIFVFTAVRRCRIYCSCRDMQLGALLFSENCKLMQDRVRKFMPMSSANQNPQTNWINQCEARKTKSERQKVCQETVRAFYISAVAPPRLVVLCVNRGPCCQIFGVPKNSAPLPAFERVQTWSRGGNVTQFPVSHLEHIQSPPSHLNNKFTLNEQHAMTLELHFIKRLERGIIK